MPRLLSALAVLLLAAPAAALAQAPELPGTTVLGGERSGYVRVTLPRDVALDFADPARSPVAIVDDDTYLPGFLLRREQSFAPSPGIVGRGARERRLWIVPTTDVEGWSEQAKPYTLPAGTYRLYLLRREQDSGDVKLLMPGLNGLRRLVPDHDTPYHVAEPTRRDPPSPASPFSAWGDTVELASTGFIGLTVAVAGVSGVDENTQFCVYEENPRPTNPDAYWRDCPGGEVHWDHSWGLRPDWVGNSYGAFAWHEDWDAPDGARGVGANKMPLGGIHTDRAALLEWMSYDGEPNGAVQPPQPSPDTQGSMRVLETAWSLRRRRIGRGTRSLRVTYRYASCTPEVAEDPLQRAEVRRTRRRIVITLHVRTQTSAAGTTCAGYELVRTAVVRLRGRLGRRALYDGSASPARLVRRGR